MSHLNRIFPIDKCDHAVSGLDRTIPWREQIFQDRDHALAKLGCEPFKDEVGVGLADGAS